MYGIIFVELKKYVDTKFGGTTWKDLLKESGMDPSRIFIPIQAYPDQEVISLLSTASRMTKQSIPAILEDFGEFIVPDLLNMYGHLSKREWKTLDFIEHTEETIHRVIRTKDPEANPPELKCSRLSPDEVVITYSSSRKMCRLAKGIAKGVARHYDERIVITETSCMLQGDTSCKISVKLVE